MNDSALTRFFGVVTRPQTWLGIAFHVLAFPLGLFYFVFLAVGIAVGIGLVVVWVGIPILLAVAGAWWLFAAFERVQARYLLGAEVPAAPRPWETADGVWGKLKAHFGSSSTWKDLAYLFAKLPFGAMSFILLMALASVVGWLFAMPFFAVYNVPTVNGTWVPPLWFGILCVPLGAFVLVVMLHLLNAWGRVCARWAELLFRTPAASAYWNAAAPPAPSCPLPPPASPGPRAQASQPPAAPAVGPQPSEAPVPAGAAPPAAPAPDEALVADAATPPPGDGDAAG